MKRRGSIYLVLLATTALVVTMAMVGLELARRDSSSASTVRDAVEARMAAESGIDYAMAYMQQSGWRSTVGTGTIAKTVPLGNATFTTTLTDDTGDITVNSFDIVRMTSVGQSGNSRVALEARAQASATTPEQFAEVVCAQTNITFATGCNIAGTGTIRAGGLATATLASVGLKVQSSILPTGLTYTGGIASNTSTLSTIGMASVLSQYRSIGTAVPYTALTNGRIEGQVVSPDLTPWGVTNAYGVYIIDCANNNVKVRDSRIIATLVFINATKSVDVDHSVNWTPGLSTYPVLVSDGTVNLIADATALSESLFGVNFNPVGAAGTDRVGTTDSDKLDTYASRITGLVYANALTLGGNQRLTGVAVSQSTVACSGNLNLQYDASISSNPPRAFLTPGGLYLIEYSWKRTLN